MTCLPMWLLIATLGQAPDAGAGGWLDAVPAEADVVVRVRGVRAVRDDLAAMLKAASPAFSQHAGPTLDQMVEQLKAVAGEKAVSEPFLMLVRGVAPEDPNAPPFAIVVKSTDYEGVLASMLGGKAPALKHDPAGFDAFDGPNGMSMFAAKGAGTVAFGPDKALITAFAKPGGDALGKSLSPALQKRLFSGDLGLYVNAAALTARYGEAIGQAKQAMIAGLDQAAQQAGNAPMMEAAKSMYAGLFDSLKEADAFALSLDFAPDGATLDGSLTLKADSKGVKAIAGAKSGDASSLAKLPADSAAFVYLNLDAKSFETFQKFGIGMMSGGKPSPELEAALAKQREQGRVETTSALTFANGMRALNVYKVADPKAMAASLEAMMNAIKGSDSPINVYKDVTMTRDAETYGGLTFSRLEMTIDPDKLTKVAGGNPAQIQQMKMMFGGDKVSNWYGVGDGQLVQITAPSWDVAKSMLDASTKGAGLGETAGYRAARAKLPNDVNALFFLSVPGLLRMIPGPPADDLPKDPVLVGAALTTVPGSGFDFRLFLPSAAGPIIEKRLGGAAPGNP